MNKYAVCCGSLHVSCVVYVTR